MTNKPERGWPTNQNPTPATDDDYNLSTNTEYKKIIVKKCFCSFRCGTCDVLGNDLIQKQYNDFNHILIEDDSKLIFYPLFS